MPKETEVKFIASLNPDKKCIFLDGSGGAEIKLTTDESQIVEVIKSFAYLRANAIEVTFKPSNKTRGKLASRTAPKQYR
jgi:hypothetical protein